MERLYNPDLMPEAEIKATFVARHALVQELVYSLEEQPVGAGVQHSVIVAPRGMGKTTILLMLQYAVREKLADGWQAVRFPEESYGITDLADFWLTTIRLLAEGTHDIALEQRAESLRVRFPRSDLRDAAYALIKDWSNQAGYRLLLLVDNFDQILEQINSTADNSALRHALMNDGTVALVGGATTFFLEARAYDLPLYNFFKIIHLTDLTFEQTVELLQSRAVMDGNTEFADTMKLYDSRLRVLHYFTGGNPRLVLMLYRILAKSEITEVCTAMERLLDEVTPYYKSKLESLPVQQRKLLDQIARHTGKSNDGVTPTDLAIVTGLKPNVVSTQLGRLVNSGHIRAASVPGRKTYYALSEPLFSIWHQMRNGSTGRNKMRWLVSFLKGWFDAKELLEQSMRLESQYQERSLTGSQSLAKNVLLHWSYVVEAIERSSDRTRQLERLINACLIGGQDDALHDVLSIDDVGTLPHAVAMKVMERSDLKVYERERLRCKHIRYMWSMSVLGAVLGMIDAANQQLLLDLVEQTGPESFASAVSLLGIRHGILASVAYQQRDLVRAASQIQEALDTGLNSFEAWYLKGRILNDLGQTAEGVTCFERAVKYEPSVPDLEVLKLDTLVKLDAPNSIQFEYPDTVLQTDPTFELPVAELGVRGYRLVASVASNDRVRAQTDLAWIVRFCLDNEEGLGPAIVLLSVVAAMNPVLIEQLINEQGLAEQIGPLFDAIAVVSSGDEASFEKLSPEVRNVVRAIVHQLRASGTSL